jgi:DNA-binding MltR family transcriptional regulator
MRERAKKEDLSREAKDVFAFRHTLNGETDRGCALMATAYLDDQLARLLRAYFADDVKAADELLENADGPLASFSGKIKLSYLLGLIGPSAKRELDLVRRVRNDFAHVHTPMSFDDDSMANRCRELTVHNLFPTAAPRTIFLRTVMGLLAVVHARLYTTSHAQAAKDVNPSPELKRDVKDLAEAMAKIFTAESKSENEIFERLLEYAGLMSEPTPEENRE